MTHVVTSVLVVAAGTLALSGPAGGAAGAVASRAGQHPVATNGAVVSTSALSGADVWAAGYRLAGDSSPTPLVEHWDGNGWQVTRTRLPADRPYGQLTAISADSAKDVWAVGSSTSTPFGSMRTLAEHWNGRKWKVTPTAEPAGATWSSLESVVAVSADDAWAVGYFYDSGDGGSLIEHWDGTSWSIVPDADPVSAFHASLTAISAVSATQVWASGFYFDETGAGVTLTERWNGHAWKLVESPNPAGSPDTEFHAVTARSAHDVWATGFSTLSGSTYPTLIEHWDGKQWTVVDSPNPPDSSNSYLYGVDATAGRDAWATGYYFAGGAYHTFAEHWNGTTWKLVDTPDLGGSSYLFGVAALSRTDAWAAGFAFTGSDVPYSLHWDGSSWSLLPLT